MSGQIFWDHQRAKAMDAQAALPVMEHLRAEAANRQARLLNGITKLAELWPSYDVPQRIGAVKTLYRLLSELVDAIANQHRPLPTTSIAICSSCRQVTLPSGPECATYACRGCGALWYYHRASLFKPLPLKFWAKALPGDTAPKSLVSEEQAPPGSDPTEDAA